uniref:Verrucotoxin subunit beta-like n=1 Tax=Sinocyclocheilus rhinocerous TaxID=307959 RepID=A0A673K943_9TELE
GASQTTALGRPFQLGMLYDCRKDALIPGITLWDPEKLQQSLRTRPQINTDFKVTASDSIEDKSSLLNIDGSLKLSLLGGLVSVTGAAKYLNDTKKSFRQQRLTLHYHSTCRFEELTMSHLAPENIIHQLVFDNDTATHVVTAVLYGADACFVFDREVSSDENKNTVEGEVNAALDKLKFISVDVKISLKMNDAQKNAVQKFTCTFYGDFQLLSNPTNFEDALKVFTDLPKLLGEKKELAVPLRVWLYPLDKLHSRASKLQKDISMDLMLETESVIESLYTAEMKCSDLLEDSPAVAFAAFHDKILQMKQNCYKYKLRLVKKLGSLLPNIRGDVMKETALNELLQEHEESPFRRSELAEWLKERERESEIIKSVLRQLKDYGAQIVDNIDVILMDLEVGNLVSYTFISLNCSDVLLLHQTSYLSPSVEGETDEKIPDSKQKSWLTAEIKKGMKKNLKTFKNLIDSKDCNPARFIFSSVEMEDNPGSCILLYESECDEAVYFTPPSKPKNAVQKFTCTFYGDFQLPSNPTNFEDALKVFTDLPKLLGEKKELAVPLRVWLYPLDKLHSRASKLQKDISMDLILETESVVESLNTAEMRCRDLLKDSPASSFTAFHDTILQMKQNCYKYKLKLTKRLGSLLPNIRGDVMKETALNELLQEHEESPFRRSELAEWLKERERESEIIKSVLRQLKNAGAQVEVNIDLILMDLEVGNLVCFMFTSLNWSDMLLLQQKACLSPSAKGGNDESSPDRKQKSWLSPEIQKTMRSNLKMFKNLIDLNDSTSNMFIVSSREMKNNPGSCILLYERECDEAVCFIPPSPPACPVIEEVKENTVVVKVPPSCPDTVEIKLLYKPKQDSVWTSEPLMKDQDVVTLTDLRSGTEYEIKCAALGKLNYTTDSDVIEVTTEV